MGSDKDAIHVPDIAQERDTGGLAERMHVCSMQKQVCLIPRRYGHLGCCFQKRASKRAPHNAEASKDLRGRLDI